MTDHLEFTLSRGSRRNEIHSSEIMDLFESDSIDIQDIGDGLSSGVVDELFLAANGSSTPEDHSFCQTPENVHTDSVGVESLDLVDRFNIMKNQVLNEMLRNQCQPMSDEARRAFDREFELLQQCELEQLENMSVSIKVILLMLLLFARMFSFYCFVFCLLWMIITSGTETGSLLQQSQSSLSWTFFSGFHACSML